MSIWSENLLNRIVITYNLVRTLHPHHSEPQWVSEQTLHLWQLKMLIDILLHFCLDDNS